MSIKQLSFLRFLAISCSTLPQFHSFYMENIFQLLNKSSVTIEERRDDETYKSLSKQTWVRFIIGSQQRKPRGFWYRKKRISFILCLTLLEKRRTTRSFPTFHLLYLLYVYDWGFQSENPKKSFTIFHKELNYFPQISKI